MIEVWYDITESTDTDTYYKKIIYLDPVKFIDYTNTRKSSDADVISVSIDSGPTLLINDDLEPTYWTTFDNEYVVFDSYDADEDTTLQQSKTQVLYHKTPTWTESDSFTPDLDEKLFPTYLAEVKRRCFLYFRQTPSAVDERSARRG